MGTALALVAAVLIALGGWWIYLATGARKWTAERDPLGEPPVKMAALIAAIVIGVALVSTGGGGAEREGAMQQAAGDDDGLFSGASGTAEASASGGRRPTPTEASPNATNASAAPIASSAKAKASGDDLPSYGKLVVRARKAAVARGAEIHWYPTLAAEAEEATERRSR